MEVEECYSAAGAAALIGTDEHLQAKMSALH